MSTRLPRTLQSKRDDLAFERHVLLARLAALDGELQSLDYTLRVLDPDWEPPQRVRRPAKGTRLPRGAVAQSCLHFLRSSDALWAAELVDLIAARFRVKFEDRRAELDFASAVAMALRRYERRGILEVVDRDSRTGALQWRLRLDDKGRLTSITPGAAPSAA